jgi:uncharacterized protein (TIGR00290 family)
MQRPKAWMAWSSGKDSAWALHLAQQSGDLEIVGLLTTISDDFRRISMHGVREALLEAQAATLRLPLHHVRIPTPCPDEVYSDLMRASLAQAEADGVTHVIFGDLFLEDVRAYREARLREAAMTACFPLWKSDTTALAHQMIENGLRAVITCVDLNQAPREIIGRAYDEELLASLPASVDPCGENGEFHTFVWDGPLFAQPIEVDAGEVVERDGFLFLNLLTQEP